LDAQKNVLYAPLRKIPKGKKYGKGGGRRVGRGRIEKERFKGHTSLQLTRVS